MGVLLKPLRVKKRHHSREEKRKQTDSRQQTGKTLKGNAGGASARPGFPGAAGARSFEARPDGDRCPACLTCHQTVILRMAVATWVYVNVPRGNGSQTSARDSSAFC
ncbi:hypothetical protein AM373_27135 (plasmid) [Klebsiella pneumoniae]|nr:hypothetical protein AM373_27135 [Klebsiella pneumoniae]AWR84676.1 hypothetical protein B9T59_27825 [Escherichia coli]OZP50290.1 hypothetical protein CIG37_25830 [Serratia marcescens]OZP55295.1 hypothetical protein CIG56_26245 [Serratia marcescens]OZP92308.1 hypothetical protein CIG27_27845 [Klebsiella pneumoniae]